MPAAGAVIGSARSLKRIIDLHAGRPLELETDRHEVVGRPGAGVFEAELPLRALADLVDFLIELILLVARDEKRGVHDHFVPDHLVRARSDRRSLELLVYLAHVRVGLVRERLLNEPTELHAREVRRRLLIRFDLGLEATELLVLLLDLAKDGV